MIPYCILAIEDDDDRMFMEELFMMNGAASCWKAITY